MKLISILALVALAAVLSACNQPATVGCPVLTASITNVTAQCTGSLPGIGSGSVSVSLSPIDIASLIATSGLTGLSADRQGSTPAPPAITATLNTHDKTVTFKNASNGKSVTVPLPSPSP